MLTFHQQRFVDETIHHPNVKQTISSPEEFKFKKIMNNFGKENVDWIHQKAFIREEDGLVAISDFCFLKEKLIIELDGSSHKRKQQRELDIKRDKVFGANEYELIRIKTPLTKDKKIYWSAFIDETLKMLREETDRIKINKSKKRLFSDNEFNKEFLRRLSLEIENV